MKCLDQEAFLFKQKSLDKEAQNLIKAQLDQELISAKKKSNKRKKEEHSRSKKSKVYIIISSAPSSLDPLFSASMRVMSDR